MKYNLSILLQMELGFFFKLSLPPRVNVSISATARPYKFIEFHAYIAKD